MATSTRQTRQERSCGGVVVRVADGASLVAMIATRGKTRWGLPKGAPNRNETTEQAALREVWEETGIRGKVVDLLDTIEYFFRAGDALIRKRVDFFLMDYVDGELRPQLSEVDAVEWVDIDRAIERASFDSERRVLEKARDLARAARS